jgi:uncharacterized protein YjiS (DUF1127 family)
MTMLANIQPSTGSNLKRSAAIWWWRLKRIANHWVAAALAYRERQAALYALRGLNDRELKDIGLYRGELDQTLQNAAQLRRQRYL